MKEQAPNTLPETVPNPNKPGLPLPDPDSPEYPFPDDGPRETTPEKE